MVVVVVVVVCEEKENDMFDGNQRDERNIIT